MTEKTINNKVFEVSDELKDFFLYEIPDSSQVSFVGFNLEKQEAFVQFKRGPKYIYLEVPEKQMTKFGDFESKGKYVNEILNRGGYEYLRRDDLEINQLT